jgi:subtilisin family serine protease
LGRRFLLVFVLSLVTAVTAAGAFARTLDEPLQGQEWWLGHIGITGLTPPGPGVPITIIDSGTDPTHPEFAGRPNTTFENDQTTFGREEYHGTAVASVAAAPVNGVGIVGVYPTAALQVWDASPDARGITDFTAISDIDEAAGHCPAVINLSFGSTDPDPQLQSAILNAVRAGCLIVAASGNSGDSGSPTTFPASWPHVFTVGATDENDKVTSFSTTGPALDVVAPGVDIIGAVPLSRNATGYDTFSGTSFSSPIVAAAAAWVWTMRPTLTASQLAQVLRSSAHDIGPPGYDTSSGYGLIDVAAALVAPTPPTDPNEPNDDIDQVKPGRLFADGEAPLTTPTKPSTRIAGSLDSAEDPRDIYRIWVPAKKVVHVSVESPGTAAARIWGPQTVGVNEGLSARRRDLKGPTMAGGKKGSAAYVEVLLTGREQTTRYLLSVTAAKH